VSKQVLKLHDFKKNKNDTRQGIHMGASTRAAMQTYTYIELEEKSQEAMDFYSSGRCIDRGAGECSLIYLIPQNACSCENRY
jgi:hypothetical protein